MTRERFEEIKRLAKTMGADERAKDRILEAVPELVAALERIFDPEGRPAVVVESPYAGDVEANTRFARLAMLDSLTRGEAPFAGHLLYTQVLADSSPTERELGIRSHLAYVRRAERLVVYVDLGISSGMKRAICLAEQLGIPVESRRIA
jgi:hypothetical protein